MAHTIIMPKAGMAMEEGTIITWFKGEGDTVEKGEPLLEIETDKTNMEVESPASGTILTILYGEGAVVPVTRPIGFIGEPGEAVPEAPEDTAAPDAVREKQVTTVPAAGTLGRQEGNIAATPAARRLAHEKGIDLSMVPPSGSKGEIRERDVVSFHLPGATPGAIDAAVKSGIDLSEVSGSGIGGRIRRTDVELHIKDRSTASAFGAADERSLPLSGMREVIARRMLESHQTIPPVTLETKADVTRLLSVRKELNESTGEHVTINDFVLKAAATALAEVPGINVSVAEKSIIHHGHINIGIAVALENGLIVPVIKDANFRSIFDLSREVKTLAEKAREGKLLPDDYSGGTFTITNLGMLGITSFTPIINMPESAILGVCAIEDVLKMNGEAIENRNIMTLCLTHDHRSIDGAQGARFLQTMVHYLENPAILLAM